MELEIWSQLDKRDESNAVRLLRDHYDEIDVNLLFRGYTMLHMACIWGHNKAIKLLLAHPGIDVNLPDSSGLTPLHIACYNARIEIVKLLLADERVDKNVKGDDLDVLKLLVNDERVDVNAENDFLCTPLMMCAQSERVDELEYMLANRLVTHIDQAIFYSHPGGKCHEILTLYKDNPAKVKAVLRFKLGLSHKDAASLFLDVVMLCDGYFEFTDIEMNNTTFRFFLMVKKLPMELQMTLCNVCYYINKPFISMLLINNALKKIK